MKKATCIPFVHMLNTIHQKGILTKAALMADPVLYTEFWLALQGFCHFALLSKTGGKNRDGEILPGNAGKIEALENRGAATRDEVETDCLIKIIEKLDLVLRQPIEKQKNYCYTICNNMVNDCFRKLPPDDFKCVPLNETITGARVEAEDTYTYENIIADDTYNPERLQIERETVRELRQELQAKRAREQAESREAILREVALLSKRPAEVLVYLCSKLGMKSAAIAEFIIENGAVTSYAKVLMRVSDQFCIPLSQLQDHMKNSEIAEKDLKLDTKDEGKVMDQVYHLKSRAKKRIDKINL